MKTELVSENDNLNKEIIQWAVQYLADYQQSTILCHKCVVDTSYSTVYRFEITTGIFYLKQVPEALFIESKVLAFLREQGFINVPELVVENKFLHCVLMVG